MSETINIDDLTFSIRRSARRKTIGLTVERDASLVAHLPKDTDIGQAIELIRTKLVWIGALMRSKWIDGNLSGDCETLLGLFSSESTDAWERNTAAYYLAVYEDEQRRMKWRLAIEAMCRA